MNFIFDMCVTMLYDLADLIGLTYKQVNVLIFCILWPLVTIVLLIMLNQKRKEIAALKQQLENKE